MGRTGTTLTLTNLAIQIKMAVFNKTLSKVKLDPAATVTTLRAQRVWLVETEEQYYFIYKGIRNMLRDYHK